MRNLVRKQIYQRLIKLFIIILVIKVFLRLDSDDQLLFQVVKFGKEKEGVGGIPRIKLQTSDTQSESHTTRQNAQSLMFTMIWFELLALFFAKF